MSILAVGFPDGIGINSITVGLDGYVQLPYVGSVKYKGIYIQYRGNLPSLAADT